MLKKVGKLTFICAALLILTLIFSSCLGSRTLFKPSNSGSVPGSTESGRSETGSGNASSSSSNSPEWKQFLKEYEEWVDVYITFLAKYKNNPTDLAMLSEYAEMLSNISDWSVKAEKIMAELAVNSEALKEYTAEINRISQKLNSVN